MNYKEMMINQAKSLGRINLHPYAIGVITSIIECNYAPVDKVNDISLALEGMNEAWNDLSLPWDATDAKKAPLSEGTQEKVIHLDCTIDTSKVEPLVDRVWAEKVLENDYTPTTLCDSCKSENNTCDAIYGDLKFRNGWGGIVTGCRKYKAKENGQ